MAAPERRARASWIGRRACEQVEELTGHDVDQVVAMHRDGDLWVVEVDVVEVHRIPSTTDNMATVRIRLDADGEVVDMERTRRWVRTWKGDLG